MNKKLLGKDAYRSAEIQIDKRLKAIKKVIFKSASNQIKQNTEEQPIPDISFGFDSAMAKIEEGFNDPELFSQATEEELQACLDMADKVHAAVTRFKMTVGIAVNSLKEEM